MTLAAYLLLFVAVGAAFVLVHLLIGKLIRPAKPDPEKRTIYECGEPTIGSAWIQFDLRFYVIALLFVIFDVEVAFFFPWAEVFGKANDIAAAQLPDVEEVQKLISKQNARTEEERAAATRALEPFAVQYRAYARTVLEKVLELSPTTDVLAPKNANLKFLQDVANQDVAVTLERLKDPAKGSAFASRFETVNRTYREAASGLAWIAFGEIIVFFGVLLVGFAYLWKRGDLAWVRSIAAERTAVESLPVAAPKAEALAGAGSGS